MSAEGEMSIFDASSPLKLSNSEAPRGRFELPPPIRGPALKAGALVHLATSAMNVKRGDIF